MKKNLWQSVLAVLLSAAFFLVTLPMPAGAEEEILSPIPEGTFSNEDIYGGVTSLQELTDEDIVGELAERREASVKHFQMTDGTVVAAVYDEPVHFQNEAGQWIDLDNTLSDTGSDYENTEAPVRVKFSKNPSNGKLYTLQGSDYQIKWGLEGMQGAASARKIALLESEKDSKLGVRSTSERLIYENALPNVDLAYRVTGRGIKEDIILQSKDAVGSFVFTLQTNRMTVEQEGNEILLYNLDGQAVYVLSAPYMTDAAGRCSTLLTMTLSGSGNHHTVTLTPDAEWLESAAYPVVIDPVLEDSRSRSQDDMKSISVYTRDRSSAYPDGNDPGNTQDHGTFYVGNESSSYDNLRAVLKFDLPDTITSADRVIQSHLRLWKNSGSAVGDATMTVNIHQINTDSILSDANFNSLTWETLEDNLNTTVMDSQFVEATTADTHVWFDITTATREWYQSSREHFGIAFTSDNEFVSRKVVYFCSPVYSSTDEYKRPYVSIQYVNQNGLEDYLTYHSAGTAETGVFSVSDFTGNLVFSFSDAETTGNYMPIAVSHIYDSSTRSKQNNQTGTAYFGNGFRLNLYSRVLAVTDADLSQTYPYQFIDSDGTWHYFQLKSGQTNVYVNEYDSSSVLTRYTALQNGNERYELKLGETVAWYFREDGYPTRVRDITTGKTATLTMSGSKLTKVTDGAGHEITFGYTDRSGKEYLTSVTDPSGRVTTYSYDANNRLVSVVRPGNKGFSLVYDSAGNLTKLTSMNDPGVEVTYSGNLNRVSTLTELGVAGAAGRKLTFAYGTGSTTVTDRDGKSETMLFDSFGHTVSIQDHEGRAVFGKYTNTDDAKRNSLTYTSDLRSNVTNYVANPDFEDSAISPWTNYNNNNPATGTTTLSTTDPYAGAKSMKITCNDTSGRYGYWQKLNIPEVAGETFTLSAWVKVTNITLNSTTPYGLMFYFGYKREDGSWDFHRSNPIKSASDWTRVSHTYTVPDDVVALYVTLGFENASGTAYFDNVQVEKGTVVNQYNMLDNGHFRDADNTALPAGWTASDHTGTGDYVTGGRFRMTGERENWQNIRQPVPVFGSAGDTYTLAAWAQADALERKHPNSDENRYFALRLRIINLDGTEDKFYFDFEAKNPSKQFLSAQATAKKDYSTVEVALLYNYQKNAVWFDDVQLFREASQDLREYDSHGRLTKSTTSMGRSTTYLYDDNNGEISHRLKKITYPDGTTESYTYNARNQVETHTHPNGSVTTYSYDANGNLLSTGTVNDESATLVSGTTTYTGAYATSTTDPFGNTISMVIDPDSGLVESVTDAKNNTTTYQYNTNTHLVESVQSGNSKVVYGYHPILDDLTSIGHNTTSSADATTSTAADVRYTFTYDQFGNRVSTSVGSRTLSTNIYAPYNGRLLRTTYGNGDYRMPVYDSLDRVVGMQYNGVTQYTDSYDANGYLGRRLDPINGLEYRYEYDSEGRATRATIAPTSSNGFTAMELLNAYNTKGQLSSATLKFGTTSRVQQYLYDSFQRLQRITYADSTYDTYTYDSLGRLDVVTRQKPLTSPVLTLDYAYEDGAQTGTTTNRVSGLSLAGNGWSKNFAYTYDANGNISFITENGETVGSYLYDSQNQLAIATHNGKTYSYMYDKGGNIQVKSVDGTSVTYTYGDSTWKDLLTAYNGNAITYDTIGNPLTYYDGKTFTWNGRQLTSVGTTTYKYNADGIRTQKIQGSNVTQYYLNGSQILASKDNFGWIYYDYDATGKVVSVNYYGTTYYYVHNLQGDVIALTDANGAIAVEYEYDPWGKMTYFGGPYMASIGLANPFRYRGYFYDSETGFYYLNSRYYDPNTGRFLNADGYISTGQGLTGCNMFAYCGNNPIVRCDTEGTRYCAATTVSGETKKQRSESCKHQNRIAQDAAFRREYAEELAVLEGKTNLYKGVVVERIENNMGSFSLGKIYLNTKEMADMDGIQTLRHEYGHVVQLEKLGAVDYLIFVGLPSLVGATLYQLKWLTVDYFSLPWEFEAEIYGEVPDRENYEPNTVIWLIGYYVLVYTLSGGAES